MLAPKLARFLRGQSETEKKKDKVCPGETKCVMFAVALSETDNGLDACSGCKLLPTKNKPLAEQNDPLFNKIGRIEHLRAEQRAGHSINWNCYTPLDEKAFTLYHKIEADLESEHRQRIEAIFTAMIAR